jgi:hypothetical protein
MRFSTKIAGAATAAVILGGSAFALLGASAGTDVQTHYGDHLAGYAIQGNGSEAFNDVRGTITVPSENSSVPADSIAVGVAMGQNVSTGGRTYGLGLVWDDPASTCGATSWTLESGDTTNTTGPAPVPTSDLKPLLDFGSDFCVAGGGSAYVEIYQSTGHAQLSYIAGPSESDNDVLATTHGVHGGFLDPGVGVTTTNGVDAADLTSGSLASFTRVGLDELLNGGSHSPTQRITFDAPNYGEYVGTETGGAPTTSDLVTLQPSSFAIGSAFSVSVPVIP